MEQLICHRTQKLILTLTLICYVNDVIFHDFNSDQVSALKARLGTYETQLNDASMKKSVIEAELNKSKQLISDLQV
jgi:hypothetical protein